MKTPCERPVWCLVSCLMSGEDFCLVSDGLWVLPLVCQGWATECWMSGIRNMVCPALPSLEGAVLEDTRLAFCPCFCFFHAVVFW